MRTLLAPLLALATLSCAARRSSTPAETVAGVMRVRYAAAAALELRRYAATLGPDAFLVGPTAQDVVIGHDDAVADWERAIREVWAWPQLAGARSTRLRVNLAADGRSAWISDLVEFEALVGGDRMPLTLRVTEVLALDGDRWIVLASLWSFAVPEDEALEAAADRRWPELVPIPDIVDDGADALANQISRELRDPESLADAIPDTPRFVFIGTADEYVVGGTAARELLRRKAAQLGLELSREGKNRVALVPGGRIAWTITNLDARATHTGEAVDVPLRALLVYERQGHGGWRLMHAHLAHGIADPEW